MSTVKPAPSAAAAVATPLATVMLRSLTSRFVALTVTVVPVTIKLPDIVTLPVNAAPDSRA